jgi:hypothetical protein
MKGFSYSISTKEIYTGLKINVCQILERIAHSKISSELATQAQVTGELNTLPLLLL